mmetsp:Transcript_26100/g.89721  ORF Transcript_26100/g.89721 Transcript_26100/m.89721 type:complete len:87 (-) Transcript_26100:1822-2082(-)
MTKKRLLDNLKARSANDAAAGAAGGGAAKKPKVVGPMDMHYERIQAGNCDDAHAQLQFENPTVPARFFSSPSFKDYLKKIRLSSPL